MLGIALVFSNKQLFVEIVEQLGDNIQPFSADFNQAHDKSLNRQTKELLEMLLKATLVVADGREAERVLLFAQKNNLLLSVDE